MKELKKNVLYNGITFEKDYNNFLDKYKKLLDFPFSDEKQRFTEISNRVYDSNFAQTIKNKKKTKLSVLTKTYSNRKLPDLDSDSETTSPKNSKRFLSVKLSKRTRSSFRKRRSRDETSITSRSEIEQRNETIFEKFFNYKAKAHDDWEDGIKFTFKEDDNSLILYMYFFWNLI